MPFPADLWSPIRPLLDRPVKEQAATLANEVVLYFGGPRDLRLARAFLGTALRPGVIYVYGAGSHSQAILAALTQRSDVTVAGFIDQRAAELKSLGGHEVITLEQLVGRSYDYILVSYDRIEAKLVDRLVAAGVPPERIQTIYSDLRFIDLATEQHFARLVPLLAVTQFDHVIVRSGVHEIVSDEMLARIFPPERTLMIHIGMPTKRPTAGYFWFVDASESMTMLTRILQRVQPKVVYAATAREYDLCTFVVKAAVPQARFIHEIYDFFTIIPPDWIKLGIDASDRLVELMELAAFYSTRVADLVVSKRSGAPWYPVQAEFPSGYDFIYPGIGAEMDPRLQCVHSPDRMPPPGPLRILYAGALMPSNFEIYRRSDYNFMPMLRRMADEWGVLIDCYNSSHEWPLQDHQYRLYFDHYDSGGLRYHRRVGFEHLLSIMPQYHYGWLCLAPRERELVDQQVVICNRFSAYIYGCLPIIVDSEWTFIADLVREFDAGIVIENATAERVMAAVAASDNRRHREGARRLAMHMQSHNCAVLDRLRALVQES